MDKIFARVSSGERAGRLPFPCDQPLAIVDVETTGGNALRSRIIEIGVVRIEPDGAVSTYESLVHPGRALPGYISALTASLGKSSKARRPLTKSRLKSGNFWRAPFSWRTTPRSITVLLKRSS